MKDSEHRRYHPPASAGSSLMPPTPSFPSFSTPLPFSNSSSFLFPYPSSTSSLLYYSITQLVHLPLQAYNNHINCSFLILYHLLHHSSFPAPFLLLPRSLPPLSVYFTNSTPPPPHSLSPTLPCVPHPLLRFPRFIPTSRASR